MQSLALPRPTSLHTTPSGRPVEPEDGLAKFRPKFSPTRPEQHSYPSPPMSEPHSPTRRHAQTSETVRQSYPPPVSATQRPDAGLPLLPPSSSLFDPRVALNAHGHVQQRPLYPGEPQHRAGQVLQYQPVRPTEQHSYNHAPAPNAYGYGFANTPNPYAPGAQHGGSMVQQAALIAPPPARPNKPARRTKAHVASACVNCKKAHLSCDIQRPCGRCVSSGKQDSCKDVQHKKRGRPRLRDDREFTRPEDGRPPSAASSSHRPAGPVRVMMGTASGPEFSNMSSNIAPSSDSSHASHVGGVGVTASSYPAGPNLAYHYMPVAFLNLDLVIQKSNQAFADLVSFLGDVKGKHLGDLLEARQGENLQRLRNELREERDEREPAYMAPITPIGHDPMHAVMEAVADQDINHVSQGFTIRSMFLSFRRPGSGHFQSLQVQIRLAKTSLYFVTLVIGSPARPVAPALLTQQLAPPTTMSAPSHAPGVPFPLHSARPASSTSSAPSSPFFNFASIRTSLPAFSPSSYGNSPSYSYSPTAGPDSGYFPTMQPPSQLPSSAYPSPYATASRNASGTSEPLRELNRPARLEGLHLPPIRTGPAPLGSPLHIETSQSALRRESDRVRQREAPLSAEQRRPETPESGKRRRLNIHEMLD
ncbi:hypothetical protein T440DRAFT_105792 [Plenodomus tracheiphilus IPT5]|uniref:Zn(2)-C6 fungal-type domain-containing protein n=1 Tax=Plenodomus tracheiphilus IPT5 TaxID=1408161 RepID=A0A6A7BPZ1_9PLEO|nr:hypothetical protein T440DRAFT_105792 [Plenodomus tracheiphilus IPT5]